MALLAVITSPDNEKLKLVRKLASRRWRDKLGLFVAEGEDIVTEALAAGYRPRALLGDAARPPEGLGREVEPVEPKLLAGASALGHAPRVIGVFESRDAAGDDAPPRAVALWHVADPGNVGTLIRAAAAFDAAVRLSPGSADPFGPKALRAAMGATFRTPIFDFRLGDFSVALVLRAAPPLWEVEFPAEPTFVLGSEREGLPADLVDRCDMRAAIPQMERADSLNVAMAGTVALYEAVRRSAASAR